jgi:hypothetical protein
VRSKARKSKAALFRLKNTLGFLLKKPVIPPHPGFYQYLRRRGNGVQYGQKVGQKNN